MFTESDNRSLDEIMKSRRICRKFNGQVPSKEDVAAVVEAGRLAPYASISAGDVDVFRHFFVIFKYRAFHQYNHLHPTPSLLPKVRTSFFPM